jgi:hypothetical protein
MVACVVYLAWVTWLLVVRIVVLVAAKRPH